MIPLADRNCRHRFKNDPDLSKDQIDAWLKEIGAWEISHVGKKVVLEKTFEFSNFSEGIHFASEIAKLADAEDHHPELLISWGKVRVHWWTHTVEGLSENDFIMAAKLDHISSAQNNK